MEQKKTYTRRQRFANWFYYNKIWVLACLVVLWIVGSMVWNVLGIGKVEPDCSFVYVGSRQLPEDCVQALEQALASLAEDYNGDGTVAVALTQCVSAPSGSMDNQMYGYGSQVTLLADITENTSHFFLLEDPIAFQQNFQVLARLDGSAPEERDYSAMDKVFRWENCPVLSSLELGSYSDAYLDQLETGENRELLKGLYLGRRYYYGDSAPEHLAQYEELWNILTEGATQ